LWDYPTTHLKLEELPEKVKAIFASLIIAEWKAKSAFFFTAINGFSMKKKSPFTCAKGDFF
jgi:hypothetical protein